MNTKKLATFAGLLTITLYLIGCGPVQAELEAQAARGATNLTGTQTAADLTPAPTPTLVPRTKTPTATSATTSTDTPLPSIDTPTPKPTNTPTIISTPTLTSTDKEVETTPTNIEPDPALAPPLEELVTFSSNAFAEFTGMIISFQHPRQWQTSYFSDSGALGWLVSDADPNDAFWGALQTGDEIVILLMPLSDPEQIAELQGLSQEPDFVAFEADGKKVLYLIANREVRGAVFDNQAALFLFGSFPAEKETGFRQGIETILTTLDWTEIGEMDLSEVWLLGTRSEGQIGRRNTVEGYVPLASISEWVIEGSAGQKIDLTLKAHDPEVTLILDVLDGNGESLLPSGPSKFTGSFELEPFTLPADDTYTIQVTAPTGFAKYFPDNPASEAKVYGWYQISLE